MYVNNARSVSEALYNGLHALRVSGITQESRVGDVLVLPHPVLTVYKEPLNRVLFSPMRDANPFFHVMEALWMLAGRNDLPWLAQFNKRISSYSDDGGATQPGAYGYRWRNYFGYDQLASVIAELKANPQSRRVVLAMWDGGQSTEILDGTPASDLMAAFAGSNDVPCNTHVYFDAIDSRLNMTVCCRSNDIIWGAYGANAVHFSFLLEYIAAMTGIPMGVYRQFSNNFHLYTNIVERGQLMPMARDVMLSDKYLTHELGLGYSFSKQPVALMKRVPLVCNAYFDTELTHFIKEPDYAGTNPFFLSVAKPMFNAYMAFKRKDYDTALELASTIRAEDWQIACVEWLQRRKIKAGLDAKRFTEVVPTVMEVPDERA